MVCTACLVVNVSSVSVLTVEAGTSIHLDMTSLSAHLLCFFPATALAKSYTVFNERQIIFYKYNENLVNQLCSKVMSGFYLTQGLSMCVLLTVTFTLDPLYNLVLVKVVP
jgi:hypothetical protein